MRRRNSIWKKIKYFRERDAAGAVWVKNNICEICNKILNESYSNFYILIAINNIKSWLVEEFITI